MSSKFFIALLGGLLVSHVAALPAPQALDLDAISALPPAPTPTMAIGALSQSIKVNTAAAAASVIAAIATEVASSVDSSSVKIKRDTICPAQPLGYGPLTNSPDTAAAFLANPVYGLFASNASTPAGYTKVYSGLNGSTSAVSLLFVSFVNWEKYVDHTTVLLPWLHDLEVI